MNELVDIIPPAAASSPPPGTAEALLASGASLWPWLLAALALLAVFALFWHWRRALTFAFWLFRLRSALRHGLPPDQAAVLFARMLAGRLGAAERLGALHLPKGSPWTELLAELEPLRFGPEPADAERLIPLIEQARALNWRGGR